jgi:hypothetical protein
MINYSLSVSFVILVDKYILKMWMCSFYSQKGAFGVKQPYIRVVGLEQTRDNNSNSPSNFTLDEVGCFPMFSLMNVIFFINKS